MAKDILKPFTVEYECYSRYDSSTTDTPRAVNANGELTIVANDILEAINLANGKLTGFVGNAFEIINVSKGYNIPTRSNYIPYYSKRYDDKY